MSIDEYIPIVGKGAIEELKILAEKLPSKVIKTINSTQIGGGVAEILNRMVPLLNELGVLAKWEVIGGNADFFSVTKKIHNALHGAHVTITDEELDLFLQNNRINAEEMDLNGDIVFIHDPQPLALVEKKEELGNKWAWRCHIDTHAPNWKLWGFLRKYVEMYDAAVFSSPSFAQMLTVKKFLITPSIDPLSLKNQELSKSLLQAFSPQKFSKIVFRIP